jgi:hypothetical protein
MQKHVFDPARIEFTGRDFLIYNVSDLMPRHANFPHGTEVTKPNGKRAIPASWRYKSVPNRKIDILYSHQTAGAVTTDGFAALINTYNFMQAEPAYTADGKWTGRGRGWPSGCYTYYIPYKPLIDETRAVIFRCWDHDWVTWHSSHNANSIAIVCQGYFRHRTMRRFRARKGCEGGRPSILQSKALQGFYIEYAIAKLGIDPKNIKGHCDSPRPKPACPGDYIEGLYRPINQGLAVARGVSTSPQLLELPDVFTPSLPDGIEGMLELDLWEERQAALVLMGHDIGTFGPLKNGVDGDPGYMTRMAIEAEEESLGLQVDGRWDDVFDYHLRMQLLARHKTQDDLNALIR